MILIRSCQNTWEIDVKGYKQQLQEFGISIRKEEMIVQFRFNPEGVRY